MNYHSIQAMLSFKQMKFSTKLKLLYIKSHFSTITAYGKCKNHLRQKRYLRKEIKTKSLKTKYLVFNQMHQTLYLSLNMVLCHTAIHHSAPGLIPTTLKNKAVWNQFIFLI
jgi:hypothetical protein